MISSTDLDEVERSLDVRLPKLYRSWLLARNGGAVRTLGELWAVHPVFDATDRRSARKTASHIVAETKSFRVWPSFPREGVAIASNNGDALVLIPAQGERVYVWRRGENDLDEVADDVTQLRREPEALTSG